MKCAVVLIGLVLAGCGNPRRGDRVEILRQAKALAARHESARALHLINSALGMKPPRDVLAGELCLLKAHILRDAGNLAGAQQFLASLPPFLDTAPSIGYELKREESSVSESLGSVEKAEELLRTASDVARAAGNERGVAATQVSRARILSKLKRFEEADRCLQAARDYVRKSGDHAMDGVIFQYTGRILWESNQFEGAIAPLRESVRIYQDHGDRLHAAAAMVDLAWAYYRLGQFDKAQYLYQAAAKDASPEDKALCIGHMGNIAYDRGNLELAIANYKHAAELARNQSKDYYANWLGNLAIAFADRGQWEQAQSYNSEALEIDMSLPDSLGLPYAMVTAGKIAAGAKDYGRAEGELKKVLGLAHAPTAAVIEAYAALAEVYARTNRPGVAKHQYEAALQMVDEGRTNLREDENKLTYLASLMSLHRRYVAFLMSRNADLEAFQVSEMSRARMLRDRLSARTTVRTHRIAEYQAAAARSGSAYLVYWIAREHSFLWVIGPHEFRSFPLPGEEQIRALTERYQFAPDLDGTRTASSREAGWQLFQILVEPARRTLPGVSRFVIVPDGPLYGLNFETLPMGSRFWIEDATIAVAPSLELLLSESTALKEDPRLLLVGNAAEWNHEFPKLINAAKEMDRVGGQFPERSRTVLSGAQATKAAYSQADPAKFSFIHFAAHAIANPASPLESAIILSSGKLTAKDVLETPVRARLVTISSCSSAGARTYAGEGLVGLAWAFLRSGARGVIAGLWNVNDNSSPILMEALYSGLAHGQGPADALRAAKLKLLREPGGQFADPYYWGAFQLYLGSN